MARIKKFLKSITNCLESKANILYYPVSGVTLFNINNTDIYITNKTNRNYGEEIIDYEPFILMQSNVNESTVVEIYHRLSNFQTHMWRYIYEKTIKGTKTECKAAHTNYIKKTP